MNKECGKTLYLECYSGISGDMTVGALLDLGADQKLLKEYLKSLPVKGFEIEIGRVKKSGLDACDFRVILDEEHENHDHDNEYLYGHLHGEEEHRGYAFYEHVHGEHVHGGDHMHRHIHHAGECGHVHAHTHEHRGLPEILDIIQGSRIPARAREIAADIFTILAKAEAKAHGTTMEEVHFHEVGAVDSIVDIVAVAVCLDNLNITEVIVPELYEGRGTVRCQHGIIPVPVPAVTAIVSRHGITLHMTETEAELVTPTGAAIVAAVRTSDRLPDRYKLCKVGIGAGKRDYGRASILRGMLIEPESGKAEETKAAGLDAGTDREDAAAGIAGTDREDAAAEIAGNAGDDVIYKLESNIDDCTGESLGYVMERLFEAGARDVHYTPVYMKKNRPAYQLNVICSKDKVSELEEIIFCETTTIGIRRMKMDRTVLKRKCCKFFTSLGEAEVKICGAEGEVRVYPEYESAAAISRKTGLSYQEVWKRIQFEALEGCSNGREGRTAEEVRKAAD